uniref:Rho-GAP domain-containing protein n=1 Tax=Tetraodon nigroviridis TaxID=99883 RepID=H3CNL8_TETNG
EGEQEEQWLADAGLSNLISEDSEDADRAVLLSTLTRTQAEAVQRRLDSYTLSLRKRNKPAPRDVRDIFNSPIAQVSWKCVQVTDIDKHKIDQTAPFLSAGRSDPPPLPLSKENTPCTQGQLLGGQYHSLAVCNLLINVLSQTLLPGSQQSEDLAQDSMASVAKAPLSTPKEEYLITDVAYCEQAVIFLKQAKLERDAGQRRKEDGTLPRFICPKCRLGVTRIQDLSHADLKKVRQLLIDMTALCDLLELEVKRHKTSKRKMPESALFGVPLSTLLENDQKIKPSTSIPLFLQTLLSVLEKKLDSEGMLRVPGSQSRIKLLQQKLETSFYSGQFGWEEVNPNDAAALLKKFIRELPAPLLTPEYVNTFSAVRDIAELKQKIHMLNLLILLLPEPNRNTLKALLEFLSKVVSRERKNKMNLWAVATIMAPNLFLHKAVPSRLTEGTEKGQAEKAADVMRLLIRYQDLLWTIPNFLMGQVRKLNENSSRRYQFYDRRIKNLLRKIHTDSREKPDKNSSEKPAALRSPSSWQLLRTVKIQVGDVVSGTMEYQLEVNSRASDLLAQFHLRSSENGRGKLRRNGSVAYPDCALYEVGGNIGEHCLDPDTHLLDLYNSNHGGEWVIKL